ncbi:hypothetical protein B0H13DRAFT_1982116, partial [Mycena leptocephala]
MNAFSPRTSARSCLLPLVLPPALLRHSSPQNPHNTVELPGNAVTGSVSKVQYSSLCTDLMTSRSALSTFFLGRLRRELFAAANSKLDFSRL